MTEAVAAALESYVERGGTLVITARSGVKDEDSNVIAQPRPGLLARLAGCVVEEATHVNEPELTPNSFVIEGVEIGQTEFLEILRPTTGQVIAAWKEGYQAGQPAAVKNNLGRGTCIYIGTFLDTSAMDKLTPYLAGISGIKPLIPGLPANVEVSLRKSGSRKLWFLLNHNASPVQLSNLPAGDELISGQPCGSSFDLEPLGVAVIAQ